MAHHKPYRIVIELKHKEEEGHVHLVHLQPNAHQINYA